MIKMKIINMNLITTKKIVPIEQVVANRWNPNTESLTVYNSIKETIKEKGLIGTITVREVAGCYEIVNGEHRWRILKELGWKEIPVENMGEISDSEAKFWTLKLNEGGKNEVEKLAKIYEELDNGQLSLLGSTSEEIQNTKDLFKFDFAQYQIKDPGIQEDILVHILSFKFTNDEWKIVEKAIQHTKKINETEKQWFMQMLETYISLNVRREPVDN